MSSQQDSPVGGLRKIGLILNLMLRLTWSPPHIRGAVARATVAFLPIGTVTASCLLFAPAVLRFCNKAGLPGIVVVTSVLVNTFFIVVFLGAGELYFANFSRMMRWPVSSRQIAWCSIIMISMDPRAALFAGGILGMGLSLLTQGPAAALVGAAALMMSMATGCAAVLATAGALHQIRGRWASTIKALTLAVGVGVALMRIRVTATDQWIPFAKGKQVDLLTFDTCLPLTCLARTAVKAYMKGNLGSAAILFAAACLLVFILAETAAKLGARSATQA